MGPHVGRLERFLVVDIQGKAGGVWKGPCGACVACGESCIWEDGKVSCDGCQKWKVACDLSRRKPHGAKAKQKGGSTIDSNDNVLGELEPKRPKVDPVLVVEIWQPAASSLSLFWDLLAVLWDHVEEQQKQTAILERIARVLEMDWEDWAFDGSEGLETGTEGSEEEEGMEEKDGNRLVQKVDKGKGKERAEDGKVDGRKDGEEGGNRNGEADRKTLQ